MDDRHNSYLSPAELCRGLLEQLPLARLVRITAVLITCSLLLWWWPPVSSSSAHYSLWDSSKLGPANFAAAVPASTSTPMPAADPAIATPPAAPAASPAPAGLPTAGVPQADPADMFTLTLDDGLYAGQQDALADDLRQALAYVSQRFGSPPASHFNAVVAQDAGCFLHGIAHTEERTVQVSTCDALARARAVSIMAHEFVHQLAQDRYGPAHLSADLILAEGVATWGAGSYWLGGQPDFRSYVRSMGIQYPLAQSYEGLGVSAQNTMYYQWASFVEFLIGNYGREKFDQVYVLGQGAPGSADYQGVYGKPLDALEQEWRAWVSQ
jgi:hypothetical protein